MVTMSLRQDRGSSGPGLAGMEVTFIHHLLSGNPPAVMGGTLAKESGKLRRPLPLLVTALWTMAAIWSNPGAPHLKEEDVSAYSKGISFSHKEE